MGKLKSSPLARLPRDQKCNFFIGPVSSWFVPNATAIWTRKDGIDNPTPGYFTYGSIGCFCYGPILINESIQDDNRLAARKVSALMTQLIDIKDDNSRVTCVRFAPKTDHPLLMVLTESGSLLVHDCSTITTLIRFKKSEIFAKLEISSEQSAVIEPPHKKSRLNLSQQVSSLVWPHREHCFLGISLPKEKTNLLIWMKLKDMSSMIASNQAIDKNDIMISHEKIDLQLNQYSSPICCMESIMIDSSRCLIVVALDQGLITVVSVDLDGASSNRVIKLARHNDQICSMSFSSGDIKKFPLGILASASRDGLVLLWDIENEFYFADYQASPVTARSNSNINWFATQIIPYKNCPFLLVSNTESGLTLMKIPENTRSKIRMKEIKTKTKGNSVKTDIDQNLKHHALIFNLVFDHSTEIAVTSSLDGNHIFWDLQKLAVGNQSNQQGDCLDAKPKYLLPSMPNNSRSHMLRHSPIREDFIGAALGKAGLRFYTIGEKRENYRFHMNSSCSHIVRKITKASMCPTSLAWHPNQEYRVAIGTLEGKVLMADLTHPQATLIEAERMMSSVETVDDQEIVEAMTGVDYNPIDRQDAAPRNNAKKKFTMDGVYSICWGPNPTCTSDTSRLSIYCVNSISHRLCIYYGKKERTDKLSNYLDEISRDRIIPEAHDQASEVAWKSTMELMALGTVGGKIIISAYNHGEESESIFKRLLVIDGPFGNTFVQCLAWHSTADLDDSRYYYLAASANETPVFIFNLRSKLELAKSKDIQTTDNNGDDTRNLNIMSTYVHKLDGHIKAVSDIAWSPHDPNMLATSSFDKTCNVWFVTQGSGDISADHRIESQLTAKFSARDRLFTVEWSLIESDMLYTSGHDSTIWSWRPSENPFKLPINDSEVNKNQVSPVDLRAGSESLGASN